MSMQAGLLSLVVHKFYEADKARIIILILNQIVVLNYINPYILYG